MSDRESQSVLLEKAIARAGLLAEDAAQMHRRWVHLKALLEQGDFRSATASLFMTEARVEGTVRVLALLRTDIDELLKGLRDGA